MDMDQIELIVQTKNGTEVQFVLSMTPEGLKSFEKIAETRGVTLAEMVGEAFRLERLFAESRSSDDKAFYVKTGDGLRELIAV